MRNLSILAAAGLVFTVACGGNEPQPQTPESEPMTASTTPDMPAPAPTVAEPAPAAPAEPPPPPNAEIKLAAFKIAPSKGKAIEVKEDGSIMSGGKPAGKIAGDHIEDTAGEPLVTLGSDGSVTGKNVTGSWKFEGDELVGEGGKKVSVADDGTINSLKDEKAKPEKWGKADAGAKEAKQTAALVAVAWLMPKPAPEKKAAEKPAAAPAEKAQ